MTSMETCLRLRLCFTAEAAERIRHSHYPQAEDFATNNVLQAPSEAEAMQMLAWLERQQAESQVGL